MRILLFALLAFGCGKAATAKLPDGGKNGATISFVSDPVGASIIVDGVTVGNAPIDVKLRGGPHRVTARKSGYFPVARRIQVTSQQNRTEKVVMVASH